MKKTQLLIIIIIALVLFAVADYYLNNLTKQVTPDFKDQMVSEVTARVEPPGPIDSFLKLDQSIGGYKVISQEQTSQIFEKIDLSPISNIRIYRNQLEKEVANEQPSGPIFLYEIHGPKDQGSLTYLNVKLQFIAQINAATETLNETGAFGHNSFFFNDLNYENTGFLLTQIDDNLFGFQYSKSDPAAYEDVQAIINNLML